MDKALTALATVPTARRASRRLFTHRQSDDRHADSDPRSADGPAVSGQHHSADRIDRDRPEDRRDLYPEPNRAGSSNFVSTPAQTFDADLVTLRIDHTFRSKDMVFARYFLSDSHEVQSRSAAWPARAAPTCRASSVTIPSRGQNLAVNWTRVITPRLLLEARFGLHRYNTGRFRIRASTARPELGIAGVSTDPIDYGYPTVHDYRLHDGRRSQRSAAGPAAEHVPLLRKPDLQHRRSRHPHRIRGPPVAGGSLRQYRRSRRLHLQPDVHRLCARRHAARPANHCDADDAGPHRQLA